MDDHDILDAAVSTGVGDEKSVQRLVQDMTFPISSRELVAQLRANGVAEQTAEKIEASTAVSFTSIGELLSRIEGLA